MRDCYHIIQGHRIAVLDNCSVDGIRIITRLNVPVTMRGKGIARELLTRICVDADLEETDLYLEFAPYPETDPRKLKKLYKSFGFADNPKYPGQMVRYFKKDKL